MRQQCRLIPIAVIVLACIPQNSPAQEEANLGTYDTVITQLSSYGTRVNEATTGAPAKTRGIALCQNIKQYCESEKKKQAEALENELPNKEAVLTSVQGKTTSEAYASAEWNLKKHKTNLQFVLDQCFRCKKSQYKD